MNYVTNALKAAVRPVPNKAGVDVRISGSGERYGISSAGRATLLCRAGAIAAAKRGVANEEVATVLLVGPYSKTRRVAENRS